jgi:hypothetical protein
MCVVAPVRNEKIEDQDQERLSAEMLAFFQSTEFVRVVRWRWLGLYLIMRYAEDVWYWEFGWAVSFNLIYNFIGDEVPLKGNYVTMSNLKNGDDRSDVDLYMLWH